MKLVNDNKSPAYAMYLLASTFGQNMMKLFQSMHVLDKQKYLMRPNTSRYKNT